MGAQRVSGRRLAEAIGKSEKYVRERVSGQRALDLNDLDAIAQALGLDVIILLEKAEGAGRRKTMPEATAVRLTAASDDQLAEEILARVKSGSASRALTDPLDSESVGSASDDEIPHIGYVDVAALRRSGVALAADERDGIEEEQELSQELP